MNDLIIPKTFSISKRAPQPDEIQPLYRWLAENAKHKDKVLEIGCGITSYVIDQAIHPKLYVALEKWQDCINTVVKHVPNIQIINGDWRDIPDNKYNLVMCDSSTGFFPGAPKFGKDEYYFRDDAIDFTKKTYADDAWIIIHDWCHKFPTWRRHREYLENNGWKLLWSYTSKYGWGIYSKSGK